MKLRSIALLAIAAFLTACNTKNEKDAQSALPIKGTWELVSGTTITKGVSAFTDYTKNQRMIKIINDTHFAFLKHSLNTKKDSTNAFDAGGGKYTIAGDQYTEHLDFYNDKAWEGKTFTFTVSFKNDTLIQKGIEKVEKAGIDRVIIEKYIRVK